MLEAEEVDDDYFTPVSSTSLANIFGNSVTGGGQNESLKYTPPKSQDVEPRPEESKSSQCLFASALIAYEWFNNTYTPRGKLGFAIIKILKTGICNIVLYDSNKTTISCALVSPKFEITVNGTSFISYYDSSQKYWSVYAKEEEIIKIDELLKSCNANVKYSSLNDKGPPEQSAQGHNVSSTIEEDDKANKESDTDSSMNRRTKISILNRMASMGHSVLPIHTNLADKTSDSSDTNDSNHHIKTVRHKTSKSIMKRDRNTLEKDVTESHTIVDHHQTAVVLKREQPTVNSPLYTYVNGQLVPVTQTNIITNSNESNSSDMNLFFTEQRINNSELRINMNRITDKVDLLLNRMCDLETKDEKVKSSTPDFNIQILQKLLGEYENKLKVYEDLLKSNGITDIQFSSNPTSSGENWTREIECLRNKIIEIEQINKNKCNEISKLQDEIMLSNKKFSDEIQSKIIEVNELKNKITVLENNLSMKDEKIVKITKELERMDGNIASKVKNIMNDTFRALSIHFENNENYAGDIIKNVIAAVIKKVTIDSLSE